MPAAAARLRMCVCAHKGREGGSHCHGNADKYKYAGTHRSLCLAPKFSLSSSSEATSIKTHPGAVGSPVTVTSRGPLPGLDAPMAFSPLLLAAGPSWGGGCRRTPAWGRRRDMRSAAAPLPAVPAPAGDTDMAAPHEPSLPGHHFCSSLLLIPSHFCMVSLLCV